MNVSSSISRKKMKSFFPKNHDFNFNHVIIEVITRCLRHHPNEGVPMAPERGSLWRYFKTITGLWQSTVQRSAFFRTTDSRHFIIRRPPLCKNILQFSYCSLLLPIFFSVKKQFYEQIRLSYVLHKPKLIFRLFCEFFVKSMQYQNHQKR